jgi:hypothetical protein
MDPACLLFEYSKKGTKRMLFARFVPLLAESVLMDSPDLVPYAAHPALRRLLLLVPLAWPGLAYGLWQRRRDLWISMPRPPLGQWWQQVRMRRAFVPSLIVTGSLVLVSAVLYGAIAYGVPLIAGLLQSGAPSIAQPEAPHFSPVIPAEDYFRVPGVSDHVGHASRLLFPVFSLGMIFSGLFRMRVNVPIGAAMIALGVLTGLLGLK